MMTVYHDWTALPVMGIADRVPSGRDVPDRDPMEVVLALLPPETGSYWRERHTGVIALRNQAGAYAASTAGVLAT
jgi:hypothetical protein